MFSVKTTLYTVPSCVSISKDQTGGNANIALGFQRQPVDLKKTPKNISKNQYRALEAMNVLTSKFWAASRFGDMPSACLALSVACPASFLFRQRRTRDKPCLVFASV